MLNRHSICAPCFQDPSGQVRLCDWLCSMPCCDFSILSSPIEARVEIKLPQEWDEASWSKGLVLSDQDITICCVNPLSFGGYLLLQDSLVSSDECGAHWCGSCPSLERTDRWEHYKCTWHQCAISHEDGRLATGSHTPRDWYFRLFGCVHYSRFKAPAWRWICSKRIDA